MWSIDSSIKDIDQLDETYETISCDILIVGAGGAGLRAAIECAELGTKALVVCKSLLGKAHTVMAEGGIAASLANVDPQDSWEVHFSDTLVEGQFLSNWRIAEIFAKEAPDRVRELEYYGALFDRTKDGKIMQRPFGAHSYRRLCYIGDRTGLELIRTLEDQVLARNIPYMDEVEITGIFKDSTGTSVTGCLGINIRTGQILLFQCKAVILATGGCGKVYHVTSNSWESTGDGIALAYRAGAELMDMEMIQFHPTGMIYPAGVRGMLITEAVRGEGGILTNVNGERFMEKYDPKRMELSARDVVARSIYTEIVQGRGTPNGAVYLDITARGPDYIKNKLPSMYYQFLEFAGVDITKEKMEVAPTVHYQMGGIRVDPETCETNIKGLYAAGEVACGLHGANRLGGNSLSDILVFGRRAGIAASAAVKELPGQSVSPSDVKAEISRILAPFKSTENVNPFDLKDKIADIMWQYVGIVRNEDDLRKGLTEIGKIRLDSKSIQARGPRPFNQSWIDSMAVWNMVLDCEAIIRSALERKESRGAHTRSDFPKKDDDSWLVNVITKVDQGMMVQKLIPVPKMPDDYAKLINREEVLAWKKNVK